MESKIIIFHYKMNLKETNDFNPNLGEEWWEGGGVILPPLPIGFLLIT